MCHILLHIYVTLNFVCCLDTALKHNASMSSSIAANTSHMNLLGASALNDEEALIKIELDILSTKTGCSLDSDDMMYLANVEFNSLDVIGNALNSYRPTD